MGITMRRNEEGIVTLPGCTVKIPRDMSMLAVLGVNKPTDRSEYKEDGWVYIAGKQVKKWFQKLDGVMIWGPVLKDVSKLEARMWKIRKRWEKYGKKVWRPAFNKVVEVKEAHAKTTHLKDSSWWLYTSRSYINAKEFSVGFDWVDPPAKPKNHGIGQAYYEANNKLMRYGGYVYKFTKALETAIERYLMKQYGPEKNGVTMHLVINGRNYWYISYHPNSHALWWKKVSWPETEMIEAVL